VLSVCTHRDEWASNHLSVGTVQREVQILARVADLPVVERLLAHPRVRDEPSPPRLGGPAAVPADRRDPHARRLGTANDRPPELRLDDRRRL